MSQTIKRENILLMHIVVLSLFFICGSPIFAADAVVALTSPSADIELAFTVTGKVKAVSVVEGQTVSRDDVLIRLDDVALQYRLQQLVLDSQNESEILATAAEVGQKKQDLLKLEQAFEKGAATSIELEHGKLEVEIGGYRLEAAKHDRIIAGLKTREVEAESREYTLSSPVNGVVERLDLEVGETAKSSEPAVRVVRLDPLWAEAAAPLDRFEQLAPDMSVTVRHPDGRQSTGKVIFRGSVADSASETVKVRLEIPNPDNRYAGERVLLLFDD